MIDIHAHILPGVDDGSPSLESSLEMAALAVESGVHTIIATPHCNLLRELGEGGGLDAAGVRRHTDALSRALSREGIPLCLYPGMEIFGTMQTAQRLREGTLCTLSSSRYPLIEFPFVNYAEEATEILESVLRLGMRPIVAHPERYRYTQMQPQLLNLWTDMGCLLQVNRGSLLGRFGEREEELSHALVGRGFAAFVASDAHTSVIRTPWMRDVWEMIAQEYSEQTAHALLKGNASRVLQDQEINIPEPDWFD